MRTFRILVALVMAVVCVSLSSCSKDDDVDKVSSEDNTLQLLVGTWEHKENEEVGTYQFNADYSYSYNLDSPWENIDMRGAYRYYSDRHILVLLEEDDTNHYGAVAIVEVSKDKLVLACDGSAWEYTRKK